MSDRASYTFTVKELHEGTPWIAAEPRYKPLPDFHGKLLGFDLPEGTSYAEAQEIARYMSKHLRSISLS